MQRLAADGIAGPDVEGFFARLEPRISEDPMGRKVKELYTAKFLRPVLPPGTIPPKVVKPPLYPNVVTDANAERCAAFIAANRAAFVAAEARFGVPAEVSASLLFVETRLGTNLGKASAFATLASMSAATDPAQIPTWLAKLPDAETRRDWIAQRMQQKADWAYTELLALLRHARANGLDPWQMPGSIYGAVGMCQFMPSNLRPYGADGDGDGKVDLFTVADAVASLSNYLYRHGWRAGSDRATRHKALRSYNHEDVYANTILALSDRVRVMQRTLGTPASQPIPQ